MDEDHKNNGGTARNNAGEEKGAPPPAPAAPPPIPETGSGGGDAQDAAGAAGNAVGAAATERQTEGADDPAAKAAPSTGAGTSAGGDHQDVEDVDLGLLLLQQQQQQQHSSAPENLTRASSAPAAVPASTAAGGDVPRGSGSRAFPAAASAFGRRIISDSMEYIRRGGASGRRGGNTGGNRMMDPLMGGNNNGGVDTGGNTKSGPLLPPDGGATAVGDFHYSLSLDENDNDLTSSLLPPPQQQLQQQQSQPAGGDDGAGGSNSNGYGDMLNTILRYLPRRVFLIWSHPENRRRARQVLRKMGDYLAYFTLLTMLFLIPKVLYSALKSRKVDLAAWNSAGVMTCGTVVLSFRLVYLHLTHWYMPEVQKYVVRILWMVPLYSCQSWLSLRFHNARIYIDAIRDFYEAFVIASFVYYLIELLGGQDSLVQILLQKTDTRLGEHPWPLSKVLYNWELGVEFMLQCKHGVLQYVVFKIVATVLTYFFAIVGMYGEGQFNWKVAYPYLAFFQNISVMYALYCLVMLYSAVREELEHPVNWHPLGKFLCIKGVVFFTWWQSVVIFYLRAHGIIGRLGKWSSEDVAYGLIDYCVVIEMIGFAIAHSYSFSYKEYLPSNLPASTNGGGDDGGEGAAAGAASCPLGDGEQLENGGRNGEAAAGLDGSGGSTTGNRRTTSYRPPATLLQPMNFKEALWSSSMPRETIDDIQRLRAGLLERGHSDIIPRTQDISLQEITGSGDSDAVALIGSSGSGEDSNSNNIDDKGGDEELPPEESDV